MSDLMMMMTMMTRACVCSDNSGKVFPAYIGNNFSIELSLSIDIYRQPKAALLAVAQS